MKRILIVEDYMSLQRIYKAALEAEHFQVWVANDGQAALALATEHEPDLVLLDLLMQKVDGMEFLREFDLKKRPNAKVIVFSNMASPELLREAKELGVTQYLIKAKYTPKEIVAEIRKTLED